MRNMGETRDVQTSGEMPSAAFGISFKNQSHIMSILRDTLYTDKVMAVLREYSANAWDAHRSAGKTDVPIKVTLPTNMAPTLSIRDYGEGMSDEEVFRIYTQYGESTKRETNDAVGMLGIGSKSGFAYSDSFTVTSWHEGMKRLYVAVLDATDVGEIKRMAEEPCSPSESGVEIQLSVKTKDIWEFTEKARQLYPYFTPLPEINITLPTSQRTVTEHGFYSSDLTEWTAIMGCIPYRINWRQIVPELTACGVALNLLNRSGGALFFNIGDVQVSANREELKYSESTKKVLAQKFFDMQESYIQELLATLDRKDLTDWALRLRITSLQRQVSIPLSPPFKDLEQWSVALYTEEKPPTTFSTHNDRLFVPVHSYTYLILQDDTRAISGYALDFNSIIIKPHKNVPLEDVRAELDEVLRGARLEGIPIQCITEFPWSPPAVGGERKVNKKHQMRTFRLKANTRFQVPYSEGWDIEEREPQEDDVYVILEKFEAQGCREFYSTYLSDVELTKYLNIPMPPVFGYKHTSKDPVIAASLKGQPYMEWRKMFFQNLCTQELLGVLQESRWAYVLPNIRYEYQVTLRDFEVYLETVRQALGKIHPITLFLSQYWEAHKKVNTAPYPNNTVIQTLLQKIVTIPFEADIAFQQLQARYPLLAQHGGLYTLGTNSAPLWVEYIKLVDRDHLVSLRSSKTKA